MVTKAKRREITEWTSQSQVLNREPEEKRINRCYAQGNGQYIIVWTYLKDLAYARRKGKGTFPDSFSTKVSDNVSKCSNQMANTYRLIKIRQTLFIVMHKFYPLYQWNDCS